MAKTIDTVLPNTAVPSVPGRLTAMLRAGGPRYLTLYMTRKGVHELCAAIDRVLVRMEQRRCMVAPWTISARRFTCAENKNVWNTYDWSRRGEEWTPSAQWKTGLIRDYLGPNIPEGGWVVEIGPGGGRWTELLCRRASRVAVVDVSEVALSVCRDRFKQAGNIEYLLSDGRSIPLGSESADAVWSYDVFVHVNPVDTQSYFRDIARVLKPGGRAVIHHPGSQSLREREPGWRSDLTATMVTSFASESGLRLVAQTSDYVNAGDVLSVFEKPETRTSLGPA